MAEKLERRTYSRFRVDLITQVTAKSADGETFSEKMVLCNMSGGGANFITGQADRYFQGQQLDIIIDLPGTVDVKACMKGTATITRIEPLPDSDPRQSARRYAIGVVIAVPLQFIRKDAGLRIKKTAGELE